GDDERDPERRSRPPGGRAGNGSGARGTRQRGASLEGHRAGEQDPAAGLGSGLLDPGQAGRTPGRPRVRALMDSSAKKRV
ncbi:hypothetical protein JTE90_007767, partial [Oedothorax gibbosus]